MNKQQLAQKIWASANQMRSKIEASEYNAFILGFIFYKYLSDKEIEFLKENDYDDELLKTVSEEDAETVQWVQNKIGYFISCENLFSTWLALGMEFNVSNVQDALSAFNRLISPTHKRVFENIFNTLETGLSKLGDSSAAQTKSISGLLNLIKDIPMDIKLYGNGAVTLNISSGGSTNAWTISAIDEYIVIDSELMNCFKGTVLKNDTVTGDGFPMLKPGTTTVVCTGNVQRIEVVPRWCCL